MSFQISVYLVECYIIFHAHSDQWNLIPSSTQPRRTIFRLLGDLLKSSESTREYSYLNPISCSPTLFLMIPLWTKLSHHGDNPTPKGQTIANLGRRRGRGNLALHHDSQTPFNFSCPRPSPALHTYLLANSQATEDSKTPRRGVYSVLLFEILNSSMACWKRAPLYI